MDDLAFLDATSQAELVRRKEVKAIELVDAAIERIERLNPTLNAGVPFVLKDLGAEYGGVRFTEASAFLRDHVSECDTELVVRHKRAGLVVVGKTNTPEFGILPT